MLHAFIFYSTQRALTAHFSVCICKLIVLAALNLNLCAWNVASLLINKRLIPANLNLHAKKLGTYDAYLTFVHASCDGVGQRKTGSI